MQTISVRTTQNVVINYPVASVGDRIVAYLVDGLIMFCYVILMVWINSLFPLDSSIPAFVLIVLPVSLYHLLFEVFMEGQSPGKRLMKIKVIKTDGSPPSLGSYLLRFLLRPVDILFSLIVGLPGMVAVITIAAGGRGQRLGDIAAGTTVIKLVQRAEADAAQLFAPVQDSSSEGVIQFPQATLLTDADVELVRQALDVYRNSGNDKPLKAVEQKVKHITGIQTDLPPVKFLYRLLDDYARHTARI
jgi:uncharacterized RDD family membrane protein YckC